jgi:serine/threonine-protein kinase
MSQVFLHYEIIKKLGEGGMGIVYLAQDTRLNRKVALKFLPRRISTNELERRRFEIEAQAAAGLNHGNIAQVYAIEELEDELFISLEYVDGRELKDCIQDGDLSVDQKVKISYQIAGALKAAHEKGIIHRDIKSRNIMLDVAGNVKVMDFGLARLDGSDGITKTGTTLGTTAYMAPEQLRGEKADMRSDIWSFGVVLYELFTSKMPFSGLHEPAVMYAIAEEEPAEIDSELSIPEEIRHVIDQCLVKDIEQRYQSMDEVIADLDDSSAKPNKRIKSSHSDSSPKRNTAYLMTAIVAVSAVILSLIFFDSPFSGNSTAVPEKKYIAVLPIENIGGLESMQAICDGLAETFSFRLSELEQFEESYWVTPAREIRSENIQTASQANKIFGVNLALTSSIQTLRDSTRLIIELVDADNVRRLGTRQVMVHSNNLGKLEQEGVRAVLEMLEITVRPPVEEKIALGITDVPNAYEFYLKGRASLQNSDRLDNLRNARDFFNRAIALDGSFAMAHAGLGESYWKEYEITSELTLIELAAASLERARDINDQLSPVQYLLGLINSGTGKYESAIENFENALQLDPKFTNAHLGIAGAYNAMGENEKAVETYQKIIEQKPEFWMGYKDLGIHYLTLGEIDNAITNFEKVTQITPQNSTAYSNLGIAYYYKGDTEKAKEMFVQSLEIEESALTANNLAGMYFSENSFEKAAEMYEIALSSLSDRYELWGNYAAATYWSGDREAARTHYRTAIEKAEQQLQVNPNDAMIIADLAAYYSDVDDTSNAVSKIERALELNEDNLRIRMRAVAVYENIGQRKEALNWITWPMIADIDEQPEFKELIKDNDYQILRNQLMNYHQ